MTLGCESWIFVAAYGQYENPNEYNVSEYSRIQQNTQPKIQQHFAPHKPIPQIIMLYIRPDTDVCRTYQIHHMKAYKTIKLYNMIEFNVIYKSM